jgi:hypothetical protein
MQCSFTVSYWRFGATYRVLSYEILDSTPKDGTDRMSQNVGNDQYTPRNIPEEQRSHVHISESPKSSKEGDLNRLVGNKKHGFLPFSLKLWDQCQKNRCSSHECEEG